MKLNINSLNARLYRWYTDRDKSEMPRSICSYFWSLIGIYITLPIGIILSLPFIISFPQEKIGVSKIVGGIFLWIILFFIFCVLTALSSLFIYYEPEGFMEASAWLGWGLIIILLIWGIGKFKGIIYPIKNNESSNIMVEFIRAKLKRICPIITWIK
jgi:hypothetical protein